MRKRDLDKFILAVVIGSIWCGGCAPDPYGLAPRLAQIERIVNGTAVLSSQKSRPFTSEYILYEGTLVPDGGMIYRPFYLDGILINREFGETILARKARYTEIFNLLSRGICAEDAYGRLVAHIPETELKADEKNLITTENRDREYLIEYIRNQLRLPASEADSLRRISGFVRFELLPLGIWAEAEPGYWIVKGGAQYEQDVMARGPLPVPIPARLSDETWTTEQRQDIIISDTTSPAVGGEQVEIREDAYDTNVLESPLVIIPETGCAAEDLPLEPAGEALDTQLLDDQLNLRPEIQEMQPEIR